ncbi:MAG: PQQ-binding-like beta-propeller repeat protein [Planctomycetota bacterium]
MLTLLLLALGAPTSAVAAPVQREARDDYVARFERALASSDRGAYEDAAASFERAGERAESAPVWRVHRAVALARAGDLAGARAVALEALRRGYPPSDLAAIDDRLLPGTRVGAKSAPRESAAPLALGPEVATGLGPVEVDGDLAVFDSAAYHLVTGRLFATRRSAERRVIGHVTRANGTHGDLLGPAGPRRWKHVDGRVTALPSTGQRDRAVHVPERIHALDDALQRRGLRTGFWLDGAQLDDDVRFVDGRLRVGPDLEIDLDLLRIETGEWIPETLLPETLVLESATQSRVAALLGEPLALTDRVHRFEGLEPWIVVRDVETRSAEAGRPALLAVHLVDGLVGQTSIPSDLMCGVRLGAVVHVPSAGLLLTSNAAGGTIEAISTDSWSVVWNVPWRPDSTASAPPRDAVRSLRVRGSRVLSDAHSPLRVEAHDVASGDLVFDGAALELTSIDGSKDERWIVARSSDATYLLDGSRFEPVLELAVERSDEAPPSLLALGFDGTFHAPAARIREAQVLLSGRFVPADDVAAWLWDPLHVRSLREDVDRSPRPVEAQEIARMGEAKFGQVHEAVIADDAPVVVALGRGGGLRVLAADDGQLLAEAEGRRARGWALDVSPDGEAVAVLTRDNGIYLWRWRDRARPERVGPLEGRAEWTDSGFGFGGHVSFSPRGDRILVAHDSSDRVLLDRDGRVVARIPRRRATIENVAERDGRPVLATGFDESVSWGPAGASFALVTEGRPVLHDASTGAPLEVDLDAYDSSVFVLALDPGGRRLAAGTHRGHVVCWDLVTGEILWDHEHRDPFRAPQDISFGDVAFSPDGSWVAATTTPSIHALLLDAKTGQRVWIGPHRGGRMGEPALITWSLDGGCFYYSYMSRLGEVRRVALGAEGPGSRPPVQVDLMAGSPLDVGWSGLAVSATKEGVLARNGSTGELRWAR